jgi:hypothetical protein
MTRASRLLLAATAVSALTHCKSAHDVDAVVKDAPAGAAVGGPAASPAYLRVWEGFRDDDETADAYLGRARGIAAMKPPQGTAYLVGMAPAATLQTTPRARKAADTLVLGVYGTEASYYAMRESDPADFTPRLWELFELGRSHNEAVQPLSREALTGGAAPLELGKAYGVDAGGTDWRAAFTTLTVRTVHPEVGVRAVLDGAEAQLVAAAQALDGGKLRAKVVLVESDRLVEIAAWSDDAAARTGVDAAIVKTLTDETYTVALAPGARPPLAPGTATLVAP